jgi:hypothetical protein
MSFGTYLKCIATLFPLRTTTVGLARPRAGLAFIFVRMRRDARGIFYFLLQIQPLWQRTMIYSAIIMVGKPAAVLIHRKTNFNESTQYLHSIYLLIYIINWKNSSKYELSMDIPAEEAHSITLWHPGSIGILNCWTSVICVYSVSSSPQSTHLLFWHIRDVM